MTYFVSHLIFIQTDSLEKAFGMSLRTFQRRKGAPDKPLSQEQSGRTWKFAEILAKATDVFGSQEEAE
ncbi:putative toxin-antitoxin system antitoxin component (TIGR02293 family) [Bradyrhizobium sp. CIR18]|nr:putative toxin-antitoxin system antitoxin component (TIGR02293 family) [Bradyrhizobium sp. CIR18]